MSLAPMSETTSDMATAHQGSDLPARKKSLVDFTPRLIQSPSHDDGDQIQHHQRHIDEFKSRGFHRVGLSSLDPSAARILHPRRVTRSTRQPVHAPVTRLFGHVQRIRRSRLVQEWKPDERFAGRLPAAAR